MIIEDDVLVSINSLGFIEKYKEELEKDKDIFFISLNSPCDKFINNSYYSIFPYIWGWYVSKKNWEEYRNFKKDMYLGTYLEHLNLNQRHCCIGV